MIVWLYSFCSLVKGTPSFLLDQSLTNVVAYTEIPAKDTVDGASLITSFTSHREYDFLSVHYKRAPSVGKYKKSTMLDFEKEFKIEGIHLVEHYDENDTVFLYCGVDSNGSSIPCK